MRELLFSQGTAMMSENTPSGEDANRLKKRGDIFPVVIRSREYRGCVAGSRNQVEFAVAAGRFLHFFAVERQNEIIIRAVDKQDRDRIVRETVDRTHFAEGNSAADFVAQGRKTD